MSRRKYNKRPKLHIKKGDEVRVLSGKERGKTGKVLGIVHKTDKHTGEVISRARFISQIGLAVSVISAVKIIAYDPAREAL